MYFSGILLTLATIFTLHAVNAQSSSYIKQIGNTIYCGSLVCTDNAVNCKVSTKNDPNNLKVLITTETCSDNSGNVIEQRSYETSNPSGAIVSSESGAGPEYEAFAIEQTEKAQKEAQKIQQQIQNHIQSQFNQAFQNFPFYGFGRGFPFNK